MAQTVLAVDDSPTIHALLERRLAPEGLSVLHAHDGEDGFAKARGLQPDLILLDVNMPGASGFDVCARLKEEPKTAAIPVIFLTGSADSVEKVRGLDLGAVDYVTKPFDPAELRARVRAALRTKRFQDMLSQRAQIDALTGLWNRGYFDQRLADEVAAARRYGRHVCQIISDVDHFKTVNDAYGHPFGDRVLQAVGELLQELMRATDAACRYGGEELAVILTESSLEQGVQAAERIRSRLAALRWEQKGKTVAVTASFGVACTSQFAGSHTLTADGLIAAADAALYRAKQGGRNRVCIYDAQNKEVDISGASAASQGESVSASSLPEAGGDMAGGDGGDTQ